MIGMLQILIYLLCIYLVFKGVEIFQIALMSPKENRFWGLLIGVAMVAVSVVAGIGFSYWGDMQAQSVSEGMQRVPSFGR